MPNGFKAVLIVLIVAIIGGGGYYYYTTTKELTPEQQAAMTAQDTGMTSPTDTSDEALARDSAAIDTQLTGLDADNSSVSTGVQDAITVQ